MLVCFMPVCQYQTVREPFLGCSPSSRPLVLLQSECWLLLLEPAQWGASWLELARVAEAEADALLSPLGLEARLT